MRRGSPGEDPVPEFVNNLILNFWASGVLLLLNPEVVPEELERCGL
jgi:hypothetical protein